VPVVPQDDNGVAGDVDIFGANYRLQGWALRCHYFLTTDQLFWMLRNQPR
jgi:hypothetical protein